MGFFSTKKEVKIEDFCDNFYNKNILDGIIGEIDVNKHFYEGFKKLIEEVFPEFSNIEYAKLKEEFTILRFELFALAWQHSFNEETSIAQSVFTLHFLEGKHKQDIWDRMQRYNSAIATAVRMFSYKSEPETAKLYLMRADLADKFIDIFEKKGINVKEGKDGEAIGRVINRIESKNSWNEGIIAYNLSFTLLRNLGFKDDRIEKVLDMSEALHRLMSIFKGFYNGAKESWGDVKIIMTEENNKKEIIFSNSKEWGQIDGELCLIKGFYPLNGVVVKNKEIIGYNTATPYAYIEIECKKYPKDIRVIGSIYHKIDFINLWQAFKEIKINMESQEILFFWTERHYKSKLFNFMSVSMPKLLIMINKKSTYEKMGGFKILEGENAQVVMYSTMPEYVWIPDVMKESLEK